MDCLLLPLSCLDIGFSPLMLIAFLLYANFTWPICCLCASTQSTAASSGMPGKTLGQHSSIARCYLHAWQKHLGSIEAYQEELQACIALLTTLLCECGGVQLSCMASICISIRMGIG